MRFDALRRHTAKAGCTVAINRYEDAFEVLIDAPAGHSWDGVHQLVTSVYTWEVTPAQARAAAAQDLTQYGAPPPCGTDCDCHDEEGGA